ncbi:MAG: hypothetical protein AABX73_03130 [Nanoarchaeota archaeon]
MIKKSLIKISFLFSLVLLSSLNLISAQETIARSWGKTAASGIVDFLDTLKLNPTALSTLLLGILLWIVIYSIVMEVFGKKGKSWGRLFGGAVSLIVVLLSFIYLPENFVEAIVLQYGAMGAAILAVIPLIILLYFSLRITESILIARVTWIFYIIYYFAIFIYKIGTLDTSVPWPEYIPYLAAMLAGALIVIFLGGLRKMIFKGDINDLEERGERVASRAKVLHQLQRRELESSYGAE